LFVEWRLAFILICASLVYVVITFLYIDEIIRKQRVMHRGWERAYGDLWESVLNVSAVKSVTAEDFERKRSVRNFKTAGRIFKDWRFIWQKMDIRQRAIFTISFVLVFGIGIFMLRKGLLTPGVFVMFVGYTSLLTSLLARLADQYRMAKTVITAFKRAVRYYDIAPEKDLEGARSMKDIKGEVVFENVSFSYKKGQPILKNVSFTVGPGESVAIVGESGAGKTTLVDLIGKYYLPSAGNIFIDGFNIKKIKLKSLWS
jgi:ABC-type bacteriocin/lantibiotic exporter with double-glycine peptidase domain